VNGLFTYDRAVLKLDEVRLARTHAALRSAANCSLREGAPGA